MQDLKSAERLSAVLFQILNHGNSISADELWDMVMESCVRPFVRERVL